MNKKHIVLLSCIAWTGAHCASDAQKQIGAFSHINQMVTSSKNIFDDVSLMDAIKRRISDVNTWLDNALKTNKSNTLKSVYVRIAGRAGGIASNLGAFSSNMSSIKNDTATLTNFRKMAHNFSQDRDALKQEMQAGSKLDTFKKHKAPMLRSAEREDAKQEIADVLMAYAETFSKIAQKAVTDFARIDGALYINQEKRTAQQEMQTMPQTKTSPWVRGMMPNMNQTDMNQTDDIEAPMVQRALIDMPQKPESYLLQDNDESYIKQRNEMREAEFNNMP